MNLHADNAEIFRNRINFRWIMTHFATAMGIGVLFVPQELGPRTIGMNSFFVMIILCIPLSYLSHKTLSSLIVSASNGGGSVLAIKEIEGHRTSLIYSLLLFISSFSICVINYLALVSALSQNELLPHSDLSRVIVSVFIGIIVYVFSSQGSKKIVLMTKFVSLPLAAILLFMSLMLVPYWNWDTLSIPKPISFIDIVSFIPIIIFAMNFSPCVSGYIEDCKKDHSFNQSSISSTLLTSCISIAVVVMFFSFSVSMAVNDSLLASMEKNTNSIALVTELLGGGWFTILGLFIVSAASFGALMGTLIGVKDGLKDVPAIKEVNGKVVTLVIASVLVLIGIINPTIIDLIKVISGPSVIAVGMLFPAFVMIKNRRMQWIHPIAILLGVITLTVTFLA
ncbi:hypothetical protein F0225_18940 [Vibrio pectenicida]|uniref:Serine transporter n=1 Tax=Vibrio pectenicida TaxID=62763 RepID=A0A7Y4A2A6_9VIBR|nr:hypothetical protein [Vibrio pectenicida]NOH73391.1 hypothetical protein [Vibrio pectenicida]